MCLGTKDGLPEPFTSHVKLHNTYLSGLLQRDWWWSSSRWYQLPAQGAWSGPCSEVTLQNWDLWKRKMTHCSLSI